MLHFKYLVPISLEKLSPPLNVVTLLFINFRFSPRKSPLFSFALLHLTSYNTLDSLTLHHTRAHKVQPTFDKHKPSGVIITNFVQAAF